MNWLILGATSGIAIPLARELASRKHRLFLAARDQKRLDLLATDLKTRYDIEVKTSILDALDFDSHNKFIEKVESTFGHIYGVIWAIGTIGDQKEAETDFSLAHEIIQANYTSAVSLLSRLAEQMQARRKGHIVGLSSVAGDRGRVKNYIYGSAKAGLSAFLQGLRQRLAPYGIHVLTVKPGFVDTRMTRGQEGMFLIAKPEDVAREIALAIDRKIEVLYTPWFWRFIMLILRHISEKIFKHLRL